MPPLSQGRSSAITQDGKALVIPGLETGAYNMDQMPILMSSDAVTLTSDAQTGLPVQAVPFNATIIGLSVICETATATGVSQLLTVGTETDADKYVNDYDITDMTAGTVTNLSTTTAATGFINASVDAGDIIQVGASAIAGASGVIAVSLTLVPRNS